MNSLVPDYDDDSSEENNVDDGNNSNQDKSNNDSKGNSSNNKQVNIDNNKNEKKEMIVKKPLPLLFDMPDYGSSSSEEDEDDDDSEEVNSNGKKRSNIEEEMFVQIRNELKRSREDMDNDDEIEATTISHSSSSMQRETLEPLSKSIRADTDEDSENGNIDSYDQHIGYGEQQQQDDEDDGDDLAEMDPRKLERELQRLSGSGKDISSFLSKMKSIPTINASEMINEDEQEAGTLAGANDSSNAPKIQGMLWNSKQGIIASSTGASRTGKRKNQITALAKNALQMKEELADAKAESLRRKQETRSKYGW